MATQAENELKREEVRKALAADPGASEREIAARCGCSWDMVKTVKQRQGMKPRGTTWPVRDLKDTDFVQCRVAFNHEYADGLAEKLKEDLELELPAIIVFQAEDGTACCPDGSHRHKAYYLAGRERIPVKLLKGSKTDALAYAIGANEDHGLRRTDEDKRNAVRMALANQELAAKSKRDLCKLCKVSYSLFDNQLAFLRGDRPEVGGEEMRSRKESARSSASSGHAKTPTDPREPAKPKEEQAPALRPYQEEAAESIREEVQESPVAVELPAGIGKATAAAARPAADIESLDRAPQLADHFGRVVPTNAVEAFQDATEFRSIVQALGQLKGRIHALAERPGGGYLKPQEIDIDLENAQRSLRFACPYVVCPSCSGRGCRGEKGLCRGQGWIREGGYGHLTAAQKEICEGGSRELAS